MEDQGARPFGSKREHPVDHICWGVICQEPGPEGRGVDIVQARFDVEEESRDPESGPLKGSDVMSEGEVGVKRTETWEGATLVGVEQSLGASEG